MKFKGRIVGCNILEKTITMKTDELFDRLPMDKPAELIVEE